jgi:CubicO group peptidase (beta-lactamase class C family)
MSNIYDVAKSAGLCCVDLAFGTATSQQSAAFEAPGIPLPERRYLVASLTKPIVAMALLKLAAEGQVTLTDRLRALLPAFDNARYRRITLRHLLTHTSGFADMLPNNAELRAAQAGLPEFLSEAATVDLNFPSGTDCQYSSIGFLLIGAIIEKLTNEPLSEFLRTHFFEPLQMTDTWLGMSEVEANTILPTVYPCILPEWQDHADDWGWNSRYWRMLGAPWGGMISSAGDLAKFCVMMLKEGTSPAGQQLLPAAVIRAAMADQTTEVSADPNYTGQRRPWGFGWRRQWCSHPASFGDFVSSNCIGHWGATGTLMWIDPDQSSFGVILSTTPYEESQSAIQRLANAITTQRI